MLLDRLTAEPDETIRAALLLALGGFDESAMPSAHRAERTPRIAHLHRTDGSASVHAAAGWLLGKWGRRPEDQPTKVGDKDEGRRWYVNGAGITMVKIAGPVTFLMERRPASLAG